MFHRILTLIIKELQLLLRERQTRTILIVPVLFQMILFPLAATLEVTNATIAIYDEDKGPASIELTQQFVLIHSDTEEISYKNSKRSADHTAV